MENQLTNRAEEPNGMKGDVERLRLDISIIYGELKGDHLNFQTVKDSAFLAGAQERYRLSRISFFSLMSTVFSLVEDDIEPDDKPVFDRCVGILESPDVDKQLENMGVIRELKTASLKILNNCRISCLTGKTRIDEITTEIDISEI